MVEVCLLGASVTPQLYHGCQITWFDLRRCAAELLPLQRSDQCEASVNLEPAHTSQPSNTCTRIMESATITAHTRARGQSSHGATSTESTVGTFTCPSLPINALPCTALDRGVNRCPTDRRRVQQLGDQMNKGVHAVRRLLRLIVRYPFAHLVFEF